jgi:hypothetical protein
MLSRAKHFADHFGYSVHLFWGVSRGVAYCRYEELFAPLPGIGIENVSEQDIHVLATLVQPASCLNYRGRTYHVFDGGYPPKAHCFAYDLRGALRLASFVPNKNAPTIHAKPARAIEAAANAFIQHHGLRNRIGIRVRVTEDVKDRRQPHRVQHELNAVIRSLIRLPWYTGVFVATDSEYVQSMLASHFYNCQFLPKTFAEGAGHGRYVHRQDKLAMTTFLMEVHCLSACHKIINIGGFLNETQVRQKIIQPPPLVEAC